MRKNLLLLTLIFTSFFGFTQQTLDPEIEIIVKYKNEKKRDTLIYENSYSNRIEFELNTKILFRSKSSLHGIAIDSLEFYEQNSDELIVKHKDLKYYGCQHNEEFTVDLKSLRDFEYLDINVLEKGTVYNALIYFTFKGVSYTLIFRYNHLDIFRNFEVKFYTEIKVKKKEKNAKASNNSTKALRDTTKTLKDSTMVLEDNTKALKDTIKASKDCPSNKYRKKRVNYKIHKTNNRFETKTLYHKDTIRITPKYNSVVTLTLKIIDQFDKTKYTELNLGEHSDFFDFSIYELINNLDLIKRNDIVHGNIVQLNIKTEKEEGNIYFEYKRRTSPQIAKIYSPVLMKLDGDLSDFGFSDIAPSVGFGICNFNFNVNGFRYIGLNTIVSVFQFEDENDDGEVSTRYSLSTGIYADINGYFSVGYMYDFKEESLFWILGFRLEELRKVLFKDE